MIELENVDPNPNRKNVVEVELEIKGGSKRTTRRDFWLVLKSPPKVNWKIKTKKLQGYAEIVVRTGLCVGRGPEASIYAILQFNSVIQSLLFWLQQPNLFISIGMHNDMITFRHLNCSTLHTQNGSAPKPIGLGAPISLIPALSIC